MEDQSENLSEGSDPGPEGAPESAAVWPPPLSGTPTGPSPGRKKDRLAPGFWVAVVMNVLPLIVDFPILSLHQGVLYDDAGPAVICGMLTLSGIVVGLPLCIWNIINGQRRERLSAWVGMPLLFTPVAVYGTVTSYLQATIHFYPR